MAYGNQFNLEGHHEFSRRAVRQWRRALRLAALQPGGSGRCSAAFEAGLQALYRAVLRAQAAHFYAGSGLTGALPSSCRSAGSFPTSRRPAFAGGTDLKVFEIDSTFTFVVWAGLGASFFVTDRTALYAGYRYEHISNGHTPIRNRGLETNSGVFGVSYLLQVRTVIPSEVRMKAPIAEILLAGPRGFCAGVERAIDIVELALQCARRPSTCAGRSSTTATWSRPSRQRARIFVDELDEVPDDATVIFSAHGISPAVREEAQRRGLARDRRHVPARDQGAPRGDPLRARGLLDHPGRPRGPRRGGRHAWARRPERMFLVATSRRTSSASTVPDPDKVAYLTQTTLSVDDTRDCHRGAAPALPQDRRARPRTTSATRPRTARPR